MPAILSWLGFVLYVPFYGKTVKPLKIKLVEQRLQQSGMNAKQRQLIFIPKMNRFSRRCEGRNNVFAIYQNIVRFSGLKLKLLQYFELQT